ncbi:MAG: flagellar protein [Spirochaetia bacterium]|nr:flagellar protein [Spirochaetia bacterium]
MITVHRLNNSEFIINANQIEIIEATPDTVITLVNERKLIVKESAMEIRDMVIDYHRQVFTTAWNGYWKEGEQ